VRGSPQIISPPCFTAAPTTGKGEPPFFAPPSKPTIFVFPIPGSSRALPLRYGSPGPAETHWPPLGGPGYYVQPNRVAPLTLESSTERFCARGGKPARHARQSPPREKFVVLAPVFPVLDGGPPPTTLSVWIAIPWFPDLFPPPLGGVFLGPREFPTKSPDPLF